MAEDVGNDFDGEKIRSEDHWEGRAQKSLDYFGPWNGDIKITVLHNVDLGKGGLDSWGRKPDRAGKRNGVLLVGARRHLADQRHAQKVVLNVDVGAVRVAALVVPLRLGVQARPRAQEAAYVLRKFVWQFGFSFLRTWSDT